MARRRFGIFKRASQEREDVPDEAPETEGTDEHATISETGDYSAVGETGEYARFDETGDHEAVGETGDHDALGETGDYQTVGETGEHEAEKPEDEAEPPLPDPEPSGSVAARVRAAAESAAEEAGRVQTDEVVALEQQIEQADASVASELEESERRVAATEKRAGELERIAHQAERRAAAAEERTKEIESRLAELEATGAGVGASGEAGSEPPAGASAAEDLAELRAQVENEARAAASRWLRSQLEAAREAADVRQAQAVEAAKAEAERTTLDKVAGDSGAAATLSAEAHADEVKKLNTELAETRAELERVRSNPGGTNGAGGHDPAVEEALAQAHEAQERAQRAEAERDEIAQRSAAEAAETADAKLDEVRAELEVVRAELAERSPEAAQRIEETLAAARRAAEETIGAELRVRTAQLDREREARMQATEAAEERLRGVEQRAIEAAERIAVAERFIGAEPDATTAPTPAATGSISLSDASYSELLTSGMSVAQAKRVLRRRAEGGRFESVDELDELAEFSPGVGDELKSRLAP